MQDAETVPSTNGPVTYRRRRDLLEVFGCYSLILLVIWSPRPFQQWFYFTALAWVILSTCISFEGWKPLGFCTSGCVRSSWVVAVAVVTAAVAMLVAARLHTLHQPNGLWQWIRAYGGYAIFSFTQQFLLQAYLLLRLMRLVPSNIWAAVAAAILFAIAHLPNPILTPVTLVWGLVACFVFMRSPSLYPLAIAHAIFGICIAVTVPGPIVHNMRVGRGYLTYRAPREVHLNQSDHRVSTAAWVMADAPTRR
jgi:membrane protease YdiL (CAAX protease family)